jgi:hypothetical protein
MTDIFDHQIAALEKEIQVAKKILSKNISEISISKYVLDSSNVESIIGNSIQDPKNALKIVDSFARFALDDDNLLRKGSKYLSALLRAIEIIKN